MRRRFFWSLLGAVAVTLLIVSVLGALITVSVVRSQTRAEMERQTGQIVELIDEALAEDDIDLSRILPRDLVSASDAPSVRRVLVDAGRIAGPETQVRLVAVTLNDRVIGSELPVSVGRALDFEAIRSGETMTARVVTSGGRPSIEVVAQAVDELGQSGAVLTAVLLRQSEVIDFGSLLRQMILPLLVAAAVAAVIAGRLSKWLAGRLSHLSRAAGDLAGGDLAARAQIDGSDELAEVAQSFNHMADQLEAARTREREFLMSVGHDLRTPLTTISGYVEILGEEKTPSEEVSRIAGVLDRETGRLRRLVEDLMLLARLEAKEFSIRDEPVEVVAHLGETVEMYRPRADEAGVELQYAATGNGTILIDPDRLDQIVGNLIENALRYTPEAGSVSVDVGVGDGKLVVAVADTGPGIDGDDIPHVFEKFYVARKYRRVRPEGSGLGLSIVAEIVHAMGGEISARSESGRPGTTIRVELAARPARTTQI